METTSFRLNTQLLNERLGILTPKDIKDEFERLEAESKIQSHDKIVQIGCSILNPEDRTVISTGFNMLPINLSSNISSIWEKKDLDIGNGVTLNKRDIVVHAEVMALNRFRYLNTKVKNKICVVTAFPCAACTVQLLSAGIRTIIYKYNYNLNNYFIKSYKSVFLMNNFINDDNDYPLVVTDIDSI